MFAWIPFTAAAKRKAAQKAAEKELLKKRELISIALPPRYNMLTESNRVQRYNRPEPLQERTSVPDVSWKSPTAADWLAPNPILDDLKYVPSESSQTRECPAPSYEPDTSSRYDSCSSSSSYDSGSSSSYDSGSSSSSSFD